MNIIEFCLGSFLIVMTFHFLLLLCPIFPYLCKMISNTVKKEDSILIKKKIKYLIYFTIIFVLYIMVYSIYLLY